MSIWGLKYTEIEEHPTIIFPICVFPSKEKPNQTKIYKKKERNKRTNQDTNKQIKKRTTMKSTWNSAGIKYNKT